MPSLSSIADDTEREAEDLEGEFAKLALFLFALELAAIMSAIRRAQSEGEIVQALRTAQISYRAPNGFFRQRWEDRFEELLRDVATRSRRLLPVVGRQPEVPLLPRAAATAIEQQAEELAARVTEVSARKVEAISVAIAGEAGLRRTATPLSTAVVTQRLETLAPIVGRQAAEEIMRVVQDARENGRSLQSVAESLTKQVHSTEITRPRARRIARNETLGLVNSVDYERAASTGVLREHRWLHQNDGRVRDSHLRCGAQGWIPINQRFVNGLLHPHERPAPPEEVENCRCSSVFRA